MRFGPQRCGRLRTPAWDLPLDHRGHALEHIAAKHEVVKESCGRMAHAASAHAPSSCETWNAARSISSRGMSGGKLPQEQSEWTPAKERAEQARHRLAEQQRVEPVFTHFNRGAV